MRYAMARFNHHQRDLAYRIYVTDCLRIISENTAKTRDCWGGSYINAKFTDIINPKPVDNRTGEVIAADIIKRAGIEVI